MQPEHKSSSDANPGRYRASKTAWAFYVCTLLIAVALPLWDAVHNNSRDTHPLQTDRLLLRLIFFFFLAVNFAIVGTIAFRAWRWTTRLRKGLCPKCGYDLRESDGRCPECGREFQRADLGPNARRALALNLRSYPSDHTNPEDDA